MKSFKKHVQILWPPNSGSLLVIVLSCPLIGSISSSTANQRAAQNNYQTLGFQNLYFLNCVTSKKLAKNDFNKNLDCMKWSRNFSCIEFAQRVTFGSFLCRDQSYIFFESTNCLFQASMKLYYTQFTQLVSLSFFPVLSEFLPRQNLAKFTKTFSVQCVHCTAGYKT